jgi:hypothetical protein
VSTRFFLRFAAHEVPISEEAYKLLDNNEVVRVEAVADGEVRSTFTVQTHVSDEQIEEVVKYELTYSAISRLPRERCVELLTNAGIQCYDADSIETLREAVRVNVEDGTIDAAEV